MDGGRKYVEEEAGCLSGEVCQSFIFQRDKDPRYWAGRGREWDGGAGRGGWQGGGVTERGREGQGGGLRGAGGGGADKCGRGIQGDRERQEIPQTRTSTPITSWDFPSLSSASGGRHFLLR